MMLQVSCLSSGSVQSGLHTTELLGFLRSVTPEEAVFVQPAASTRHGDGATSSVFAQPPHPGTLVPLDFALGSTAADGASVVP